MDNNQSPAPPPAGSTGGSRGGRSPHRPSGPRYKGVRLRPWGRWVSEIRIPHSRDKIWLGSYSSQEQAARAFDTARLLLGSPCAATSLNFSDSPRLVTPHLRTFMISAPLTTSAIQRAAITISSIIVKDVPTGGPSGGTSSCAHDDEPARLQLGAHAMEPVQQPQQLRGGQLAVADERLESPDSNIKDVTTLASPTEKAGVTEVQCSSEKFCSTKAVVSMDYSGAINACKRVYCEEELQNGLARDGFTATSPVITTSERLVPPCATSSEEHTPRLWSYSQPSPFKRLPNLFTFD